MYISVYHNVRLNINSVLKQMQQYAYPKILFTWCLRERWSSDSNNQSSRSVVNVLARVVTVFAL